MTGLAFNSEDLRVGWERFRRSDLIQFSIQLDEYGELASKPRPVLVVGAEGYGLVRRLWLEKSAEALFNVSFGELSESLASLKGVRDIWLSLPSSQWFGHTVEIPAHARGETARIIALESARTTPFTPDQAISGWHVLDSAGGRLKAQNIIVRRDIVNPIKKALQEAGHRLAGILVRDETNRHLPLQLRLHGHDFRAKSFARYRKALWVGAAFSILAASLFYLGVSIWLDRQLTLIEAKKDALKPDVAFVTSALETAKQQQLGAKALLDRRSLSPSPSAVLAELSRLFPNDTALSSLSLQGNKVQFEGVSGRPEELIAVLENSPLFVNVSFSAPVMNSSTGLSSHFAMGATLESLPGGT